jgi:hypothetical protein
MKKLFFYSILIFLFVLAPIGSSIAQAAEEATFELDPDSGTISSGDSIDLTIVNRTSNAIHIKSLVFATDVNPSSSISNITATLTSDASGENWSISPTSGYNQPSAGKLTISASTTKTAGTEIAADDVFTLANLKITGSGDFCIVFDAARSALLDENGQSVFTAGSQTEQWCYTIAGTTTPPTTPPTTVTTAPSGLAGTGPANAIGLTLASAFCLVSSFFFVRRAVRAWKLTK